MIFTPTTLGFVIFILSNKKLRKEICCCVQKEESLNS